MPYCWRIGPWLILQEWTIVNLHRPVEVYMCTVLRQQCLYIDYSNIYAFEQIILYCKVQCSKMQATLPFFFQYISSRIYAYGFALSQRQFCHCPSSSKVIPNNMGKFGHTKQQQNTTRHQTCIIPELYCTLSSAQPVPSSSGEIYVNRKYPVYANVSKSGRRNRRIALHIKHQQGTLLLTGDRCAIIGMMPWIGNWL